MPKELLTRAKANPCPLLSEIFRSPEGAKKVCSNLREPNGDLIVGLVLKDGENEIEVLKAGQRCQGGLVGVDDRPRKEPRWVSALRIDLEATDETTLAFVGWIDTHKAGPDGSLETIGKGCGPEIQGRVRLIGKKWRLFGPRSEGCSE
jgi:hypothetical protein